MPKLPAIAEGLRRLHNFWEQISSSRDDSGPSFSRNRSQSARTAKGGPVMGGSSPCLLDEGGNDSKRNSSSSIGNPLDSDSNNNNDNNYDNNSNNSNCNYKGNELPAGMRRSCGIRGSAREGIRRRIEAFEEIINNNGTDSRRSSLSDSSKCEKAEIILRTQEEKLMDRAQYQSVFDERIGFDCTGVERLKVNNYNNENSQTAGTAYAEAAAAAAGAGAASSTSEAAAAASQQEKEEEDKLEQQQQGLMGLLSATAGPSRPMWHQMREVDAAGLAVGISSEQLKLQEALFEIITSEASYYKNLKLIIELFYRNQRLDHTNPDSCIKALDKHHLFSNIVDIYDCSAVFLKSMEDEWQMSPQMDWLPQIIIDNIERMKVYKDYCRNFYYQTKTLQKLQSNAEFQELLAQLERMPVCRMISLQSYLELPMKRPMSLQLLMDAVMKRMPSDHHNYALVCSAFRQLLLLARECDQESKMMSEKEQMLQLQNQLSFAKVKKVGFWGGGRHLIKEGTIRILNAVPNTQGFVTKMSLRKNYLKLHAFSDLLIVSKPKGDQEYTVLKHSPRAYVDAELVPTHTVSGPSRHLLRLRIVDDSDGSPEVTLLLEPKTKQEADAWLGIFCPRDELGDPIYDAYDCPQVRVIRPYQPRQKDDLQLDEGDVLNVYKKTEEGYYLGSKLTDPSVQGWFDASHVVEIENDHYCAKIRKITFRRKHSMGNQLLRGGAKLVQ